MYSTAVSLDMILTRKGGRVPHRSLLSEVLLHSLHNGYLHDPFDAFRWSQLDPVQAAPTKMEIYCHRQERRTKGNKEVQMNAICL